MRIKMFEILTLLFAMLSLYLWIKGRRFKKDGEILGQAILDGIVTNGTEKEKDDQYIIQENFLKFVSDSREWAFEYIENTQEHLKLFIDDLKKDVLFFESFGILSEKYPNYEAMVKFVDHYRKLEKLLPEQDKND
jgi:hypothetical protein